MSWQQYVDEQLLGSGTISQAAILGQKDMAAWATSPGFTLSKTELEQIISGFSDPGSFFSTGVHAAGVKYLTIKADERSIYGKQGPAGIVCVKTVTAIIVGVYKEGMQPGNAALAVEKLADYLIDCGFVLSE
ncbi:MAG: profilin [Piptocephalis tieghemiana]|nr:MAG: profilin [Piptocephalis tieghemiana]